MTAVRVEPALSRDGTASWIATGSADGIPFVAEADSEDGALAEACALVCQTHAVRHLRRIAERAARAHRQQEAPDAPAHE